MTSRRAPDASRPPSFGVRSLTVRIVVTAMTCAGLSTAVMVRAVSVEQTRTLLERAEQSPVFAAAWKRSCTTGRAAVIGPPHLARIHVRTFDEQGRARDGLPTPAPMDAVVAGASRAADISLWGFGGSTLVLRVADDTPGCAYAALEIVPGGGRRRAGVALIGMIFLGSSLAFAVACWVAVRPLARQVTLLAHAAENVGEQSFVPPTAEGGRFDVLDDMGVLARALVTSHERLTAAALRERATQLALREHLRDVAHDLRTPVTALSLALERARRESGAHVHSAVADASRDATYLGALVENLEVLTRVKGGDIRRAPTNVCDVVASVVARAKAVGDQAGVAVEGAVPDDPLWRDTDAVALARAVANLSENAIRHGARHVGIVLSCVAGRYVIDVRDDGPGRPDGIVPGRGLTITRTLCDALGASIRLTRTDSAFVASIVERDEGKQKD